MCSAQSENLCNLEIVLHILRILWCVHAQSQNHMIWKHNLRISINFDAVTPDSEWCKTSLKAAYYNLEEWVMLCITMEGFRDVLCWAIRSSFCASTGYLTSLKLYLFMLLGICLCIMCLTPSTWKVRSNKMAKCGWDDAMLASTYPVNRSASQLLRCWHASCLLSPLSCRLSSFCWGVS